MPDNVKDNPVEKREALLADRLRLHKSYRQRFVKGRNRHLGNAEEFYPDEHPQILEREVGYIFPLMEVEPTICIELKDEG